MKRIDRLEELRARIDQEIERERRAAKRTEKLRREAFAIFTRGNWNQRILAAACHHYGIDVDLLISGDRHRSTIDARHTFMWLMHSSGMSYSDVGRELGMDHTSAINGVKRVENDERLRATATEIHFALTGEEVAS